MNRTAFGWRYKPEVRGVLDGQLIDASLFPGCI
jgi:hypothetical protein